MSALFTVTSGFSVLELTRVGCASQIAAAAKLWDGTGSFLFTSSAGIYAADDGSMVNEDSPVVKLGISERNDRCAQDRGEPLMQKGQPFMEFWSCSHGHDQV